LLIPSYEEGESVRIFKNVDGVNQQVEVEKVDPAFTANDILQADVDNDGRQEIVCVTYTAYHRPLLFYKYRNGRYEALKKDPQAGTYDVNEPWFINAHIADINEDGEVEVVDEPKDAGYLPPPIRYVWKWNEENSFFQLLYSEALVFWGVHVIPRGDRWEVIREGDERSSSLHDTQEQAEKKGRELARRDETDLFLHNQQGGFTKHYRYDSDSETFIG
jgi:hypothetical protein